VSSSKAPSKLLQVIRAACNCLLQVIRTACIRLLRWMDQEPDCRSNNSLVLESLEDRTLLDSSLPWLSLAAR
jgi:hypothetical protein